MSRLAPFVDASWGDPFSLHYPTLAGHLVFGCGWRPRYDVDLPVPVVWQDMLAQQSYYRAILRVAIAMRLSGYGSSRIELLVPDELDNTFVLVADRDRGALSNLLLPLVGLLNHSAVSRSSPLHIRRILERWIAVGALEMRDKRIVLQEDYAQTLHERRRASVLLRGTAREEQKRIEVYLKGTA